MASVLFIIYIICAYCLIWYLIRYTVAFMLVFLLFQISHPIFDRKTFTSLHSL